MYTSSDIIWLEKEGKKQQLIENYYLNPISTTYSIHFIVYYLLQVDFNR